MKISEIADLITIRSHISSLVNNSNIDKSKIRPLLDLQTDIDHAIVDGVLDEDFKSSLKINPSKFGYFFLERSIISKYAFSSCSGFLWYLTFTVAI